jgi:hypothetical protein
MRHSLPEPVLDETALVSFGPIIEPPFADAHPGEVSAVLEDVREVAVEPWDPPLTQELSRRALAVAMASAELAHELEGARYEVIGVGLVDGKYEPARPVVVVVYRYDDDRTIEAVLDAGATAVSTVRIGDEAPILTDAEVQRANTIAEYPGTGMGLLVLDENPDSPRYRHRLVDLRYAPPDHRMPEAYAIVDLSTGELVDRGEYPPGRAS